MIFTGGHHTGSLAVAAALGQKGWNIIWLGHRYSQWKDRSDSAEYREVTAAGIRFVNLKAGKLYRTYNPLKLLRLPLGFIQAFIILLKLRLRLKSDLRGIVSSGGYLGIPVVICGWLLGIPAISHEQTVSAGWANRVIALFARKIAISWPESAVHFPGSKTVFTGLPLRPEIVRSLNTPVRRNPDLIYVTGGKQGSHIINMVIFSVLPKLLNNFRVVHQTGSSTVYSDHAKALQISEQLPEKLKKKYAVYDYLDARFAAKFLSTAGVVISRAGAHIIQELMVLGTPSVLIPISWSSHSEQLKNAQVLAGIRLAVILPEDQLNAANLLTAIASARKLKPAGYSVSTEGLEHLVQLIEAEFGQPV